VEFTITGEEYEEEIPIQEGVPELTDATATVPAHGKPWCITFILLITVYIYMSLTSAGLSSALLRLSVA
jgi:hypothetical protein